VLRLCLARALSPSSLSSLPLSLSLSLSPLSPSLSLSSLHAAVARDKHGAFAYSSLVPVGSWQQAVEQVQASRRNRAILLQIKQKENCKPLLLKLLGHASGIAGSRGEESPRPHDVFCAAPRRFIEHTP
jgi:hypothetical protein